jgi:hypothetical protein
MIRHELSSLLQLKRISGDYGVQHVSPIGKPVGHEDRNRPLAWGMGQEQNVANIHGNTPKCAT